MRSLKALSFFVLATALTTACSKSSDETKGQGGAGKANALDWSQVSSEFNPSTDVIEFEMQGAPKLDVSLFGGEKDVNLFYVDDLQPNTGRIKIYKVWKKQASWGQVNTRVSNETLSVTNTGSYQCSINIKNGRIQDLEGGCYVRIDISMPRGSQVEVYSAGRLISQRFMAMSNQALIRGVDNAAWKDQKFAVIDSYLDSYRAVGRSPALNAKELGQVVGEFSWKEEKYTALRKLQAYVYDRENLLKMIEDNFNYFDQAEARRICGL